ncbi:MAG: hypothetical protein HeimC2_01960 [Candidatus Heimdallarchaeota archaeon LC_2]|nr:MAG: hypothetical protein HeimC2_01960 [Candidatus Heimdallarchaeota archaeon LC_2]
MVNDEILSREASLIYQNVFGFEPVEGDLTKWFGIINDKTHRPVGVTISLPNNFPSASPDVKLQEGIMHPNISKGKFVTRSIARWKTSYHIHQIIREVRQVISSSAIQFGSSQVPKVTAATADNTLNNQLSMLKQQLNSKQQEFETVQSQSIDQSMMNNTLTELTEDALVDIQNDLFALEDAYDRADLNGIEFSKKFLALQKRYFMIEKTK